MAHEPRAVVYVGLVMVSDCRESVVFGRFSAVLADSWAHGHVGPTNRSQGPVDGGRVTPEGLLGWRYNRICDHSKVTAL